MSLKLKINKVYYENQDNQNILKENLIECLVKVYLEDKLLRTIFYSDEDSNAAELMSRDDDIQCESKPVLDHYQEYDLDLNEKILNKKDKLYFECYYFSNDQKKKFFKKKRYNSFKIIYM